MTEFLTAPQVAKQLHVSPAKVRTWIDDGTLAAVNISRGLQRRLRIHPDSVEALMRQLSVVSRPHVKRRRPRPGVTQYV